MRWEALFDDLAAQAETIALAERAAEVDERTRVEVGDLTLVDRLRAAVGEPLRVQTVAGASGAGIAGGGGSGGAVAGRLTRLGRNWMLLEEDTGGEVLVPLAAVASIGGLPRLSAVPGTMDAVTARLGLRVVLRRFCRDRCAVRLVLAGGGLIDAVIDRVGADFLEVAVLPPGEARRATAVRDVRMIPLAALVAVRRAG